METVPLLLRALRSVPAACCRELQSAARPDDEVQDYGGATIATEARSAARMDGVTLDYREPGGFRFIHPEPPPSDEEAVFRIFNPH